MKKAVVVGLAGIFVLSAGADWRVAGFPNQVFSEAVVEKTVTDGEKGMCLLHCGAREVSGTFECTPRKP